MQLLTCPLPAVPKCCQQLNATIKIISKVLINLNNLNFFRVKRKESLRCWLFEQMEMRLIWVSMHTMCMEFSWSKPVWPTSTSNWNQQSIWNFPSKFLRTLKWASIKMSIPSQQHSLISVPHDLWGNAHPYPTSQKWRCNPMTHVMYTKFWTTQHRSQTCPFLTVVNWRDAIFACKDQSMYMEFWIR